MAKQALKYMKAGSILIDVASTKLQIVSDIQKFVPEGVYYVGTHPIAGSEKRGAENSDPNLFQGANCIITPIKETNKQALKKIKKFWKFLGSRVFEMNPETHDRAVACTSHMPHLLAFILVNECCEYLSAAGGSFKDATRVAKSNPEMWAHVFIENRRNIVKSVKSLILQLEKMSDLIDLQDKKKIEKILESAKKIREKI
jgi:prephenate dehydrogenase